LLSGCGGGSDLSTVQGTIAVDGTPVPSGTASFSPLDGGEAVSANIVDGKYKAVGVSRGKNLVFLNAFVPTGGTFVEFGISYPEEKNLVPSQYQQGIEVLVDKSEMVHDFVLQSK
jgi:hypothetical protein